MDSSLELPKILANEAAKMEPPSLKIRTEESLTLWKTTQGYRTFITFLHRLSDSVAGQDIPNDKSVVDLSRSHRSIVQLLDQLDSWIDDIPPLSTPQRFGNLAFRTWGKRLEDNADKVLEAVLPEHLHGCVYLLSPYLIISFGSFTRMDYGTGHEAAFALLLLCLSLLRFFEPEPHEERKLVLVVFLRYLRLCWRLQDVYKLEPAGSHGVWGLDDSSFLGYIFGSGQLKDRTDVPVSSVLRLPLPPTNLYYLSISRIHEVKKGPFHEHSSQLYAIATTVPNWSKVNSGLFKMYEAEVLGKRVVVQHIPVGGLLEWDVETPLRPEAPQPTLRGDLPSATQAPWSPHNTPASWTNYRVPQSTVNTTQMRTSVSSRPVDRTMLPPPNPTNFNAHRVSSLSPSTRTSLPSYTETSMSTTSLHSPPQRMQSDALIAGVRPPGEELPRESPSSTRTGGRPGASEVE